MIIHCNSCGKSFTVPDNAITSSGRLVQCSSCGNKWTQYPIQKKIQQVSKVQKKIQQVSKVKKNIKPPKTKKKKEKSPYTAEYLQKKHGIKIIDPSSSSPSSTQINRKNIKIGYGFYNYLITISIFFIAFIGVTNLTQNIIIYNFPFLENYIVYLFESLNNMKTIIFDIISNY
tara:strand:+ start:149 stop:667 length:519 start_codon:yes stop_codon:yes gene_type:complete